MFENLGWSELLVVLVLALFVFGPDRLPAIAADAGRMLRSVRQYAKKMTSDLKDELGPELGDVDLASLHPRTFVQKHLFSDDEDEPPVPHRRARSGGTLPAGEPAPWDPDAT